MTLIRELIEIPESVQQGDFVLKLSDGVTRPDETLGQYVVTPELQAAFDNALNFVKSALADRTSKASYLHGSFGSGKSHFMAVLHLILQGNATARSIPELAPVISRHNAWIGGKKFLLVPYHMIGAVDMESAILGGYVDYLRKVHPEAPIPGVYLAEGLFRDADNLRKTMGDEAFLSKLNQGAQTGDETGWGDFAERWDATRFEAAMAQPPGGEDRSALISDLIKQFFGSYDTQAGGSGEAFLPLDKGLSVLSKHAASLGYDGLILFLDELVLWLASHAADLKFVHQEGQKLAKLVEAQSADRPIPIISFVARQRDLSELIGDAVPGAERLNFGDALKHWEGRFHKITLEDRNLPAIAERRVLKPRSEAARQELRASFEKTKSIRDTVMSILLTREGDRAMFGQVYPFSPALVQTLVAVSSVLQRERTALKVMVQLLVDHRDTLKLGDIVPVGDLFDVVAHGDEAFSPEMAIHFNNARRLYIGKLLPLLEGKHGRREELEQLPYDDPKRLGFRNEDRIMKTLLLAALVPQVESLRSLNAERLAALNHGTIRTPILGKEGQEVLRRCREWAASAGEIRIGEEANPTISVQLAGVDTESIISQAMREDNHANRVRRVRRMIFEDVGIEGEGLYDHEYSWTWRNTKRGCTVLFQNIRLLTDSSIENTLDDWKLIIDFPFDEAGHGPKDDLGRLQVFRDARPVGSRTICWVPAFFSREAQKDLGTLVVLEHILAGERFGQYANHLSPQDRMSARQLLENQKSGLTQRVKSHLDAAYGLDAILGGSLDTSHDLDMNERFVSLWPGFEPRPPVSVNLKGAMNHLLGQALAAEYPAAPEFEAEVKPATIKKVFEVVAAAAQSADGRVLVDRTIRPLVRGIVDPLNLGEMGIDATHFLLGHHWKTHFTRKATATGARLDVGQIRKWINEPKPMGLPKEVENMLILTFALQTNQSFYLHSVAHQPSVTDLNDACELRQDKLPTEDQWDPAVERAATLFGVAVSSLRNASNVQALEQQVKQAAGRLRQPCAGYVKRLNEVLVAQGIVASESQRLTTARATQALLERLTERQEVDVVALLANTDVPTTLQAMGECAAGAAVLDQTLAQASWDIFEAVGKLNDDRKQAGTLILDSVKQALNSDEHVIALGPCLVVERGKGVRLLTVTQPPPPIVPPPPPPDPGPIRPDKSVKPEPTPPGVRVVKQDSKDFTNVKDAQQQLNQIKEQLTEGQKLTLTLTWRIE